MSNVPWSVGRSILRPKNLKPCNQKKISDAKHKLIKTPTVYLLHHLVYLWLVFKEK